MSDYAMTQNDLGVMQEIAKFIVHFVSGLQGDEGQNYIAANDVCEGVA